jgi:hypothetical protein
VIFYQPFFGNSITSLSSLQLPLISKARCSGSMSIIFSPYLLPKI